MASELTVLTCLAQASFRAKSSCLTQACDLRPDDMTLFEKEAYAKRKKPDPPALKIGTWTQIVGQTRYQVLEQCCRFS